MRKKFLGGIVFFTVLVCIALLGMVWKAGAAWSITPLPSAALNIDMAAPDTMIRSKGLSRLPSDMLRVPLLHDLLTEDFLFYYENSEGRLGLSGTIRRIAYEHDVNLTDELIKLVMDEPADVALWRGSNGTLKYYAIAMTRNKLAKLLEPLAKIALQDKQLTMAGEFRVAGDTVQLFALEYAGNRKLLLASHADRVVVFSDTGMLLTPDGQISSEADALLNDLLGADKSKQQRLAKAFDLKETASDHSIAIKTDFLSFSYQHFFPALKALRFDFSAKSPVGGQNWSTSALVNADTARTATRFDAHTLWTSLPYQPSACVSMPVDWSAAANAMNSQKVINVAAERLAAQFEGPAVVCWYAQSRLHTPLFLAQLNKVEGADTVLGAYFNYGIKSPKSQEDESATKQDDKESKQGNQIKSTTSVAGDIVWKNIANSTGIQATLARSGKLIYFSPDTALVEQALAVAHKRQPAVSDEWPGAKAAANTVAVIGPGQLAQLAEREVVASLPMQRDADLRTAADQHLLPKLAAVKKYPIMRLEMNDMPKGTGWVTLDWQQR
jgi:uncharacterized protein YfaA (DUF2138 family)